MVVDLNQFAQAQSWAVRYFNAALANKRLAHAYILRGADLATSYRLGLCLAQILNCQTPPAPDAACGQCQPCRWIAENAHPGVMTLTNVYTEEEEGGGKKGKKREQKNISAAQMAQLQHQLALHPGDMHRVVIVTGVSEVPLGDKEEAAFAAPRAAEVPDGMTWELEPLGSQNFPDTTANKFLKTLEEPPARVLFLLLTDAETKLLPTIVSRCQVMPMATPQGFWQHPLPDEAMAHWEATRKRLIQPDFIAQSRDTLAYAESRQLPVEDAMAELGQFMWDRLAAQPPAAQRYAKSRQLLDLVEMARRMAHDKTRDDVVLEDLFVQMSVALNP